MIRGEDVRAVEHGGGWVGCLTIDPRRSQRRRVADELIPDAVDDDRVLGRNSIKVVTGGVAPFGEQPQADQGGPDLRSCRSGVSALDELHALDYLVYAWLQRGEEGGNAFPLRAGKGTTYEGGMRVPCIMRWTGEIPAGTVCREIATAMDVLVLENCVLRRPEQRGLNAAEQQQYVDGFELDRGELAEAALTTAATAAASLGVVTVVRRGRDHCGGPPRCPYRKR